jgi:transcription elongation factor Elf1
MSKKRRKRRKVPKDKRTGLPKKYLAGLTGSKRSSRASLIKTMSRIYKSGGTIPASMFRARVK